MANDFDMNHLLAEVKIRKLLWDTNNEFYGNRAETTNAWAEICRTFYPNFDMRNSKAKRAAGECIAFKFICRTRRKLRLRFPKRAQSRVLTEKIEKNMFGM